MDSATVFEAQRPGLFGLAYRMLGSAQDAEDVLQDAFLRWSGADREAIANPAAWLTTVVTNLCVNRLTSARARRERYVGPWLPEPVRTDDGALGPLDTVARRESVSLALLVLLERLTPVERAVFVLREAFGYGHREIGDVLGVSESNSRQLHRRARQRVGRSEARFSAGRDQWFQLVNRFLAAAEDGDLGALERLLTEDVVSVSDGGGRVTAGRRPVCGRAKVLRLLVGGFARYAVGVSLVVTEVNGAPAVVGRAGDTLVGALVFEFDGDRIAGLRSVLNPDKLGFLAGQLAELSH